MRTTSSTETEVGAKKNLKRENHRQTNREEEVILTIDGTEADRNESEKEQRRMQDTSMIP